MEFVKSGMWNMECHIWSLKSKMNASNK